MKNSYLLDPESPAELTRLLHMDQMTTRAMGGPLPEQENSDAFRNILDIGCGPGGWVLDTAFVLPGAEVAGIDISEGMIRYAIARAASQELTNTSFEVMDMLQPLDFSDASFDLVNARFLVAAIPAVQWPAFLAECTRLVRPGGILRITEAVDPGVTTSPSFEHLQELLFRMMQQRGYGFSPNACGFGITTMLPQLLRQAGYQEVHWRAHALEFSAGTPSWADFYHNSKAGYRLGLPLYVKAGFISDEEASDLYTKMLEEMQAPNFAGMWHFTTFWARKI